MDGYISLDSPRLLERIASELLSGGINALASGPLWTPCGPPVDPLWTPITFWSSYVVIDSFVDRAPTALRVCLLDARLSLHGGSGEG
eukprot:427994-Pyramimonas_sp.AAC.1